MDLSSTMQISYFSDAADEITEEDRETETRRRSERGRKRGREGEEGGMPRER